MTEPTPKGLVPLVVRREIVTRVRERSFLVSTVITLLIIVAVVVLPALLNRGDDEGPDWTFRLERTLR